MKPDTVCDCGLPKRRRAEACKRCAVLDGHTRAEANAIAALRILGDGVSLEALVEATGEKANTLMKLLLRMKQRGRARRLLAEDRRLHHTDRAGRIRYTTVPTALWSLAVPGSWTA